MPASEDPVNPASLERIIPDELCAGEATGQATLDLHLARYQFAKANLVPGTLLDIACGVGYGTAILCADPRVSQAVGVDLSRAAIQYATGRYGGERISFLCDDALTFRRDRPFENIVSLETIEHVDDPRALFAHLVSLLAPGGRLIASVPVTPSVDANPHHKSNFSKNSFLSMGERQSLKRLNSFEQLQRFDPFSVALRKESRAENIRQNLVSFYLRHPSHMALRLWSIFRDGFANKYLTVVWEKAG